MVADIRKFFLRVQEAGAKEVTVCMRSLEGLVLSIESFFNFVAMITKIAG
jgi:hypothetical protein